MCYKSRWIRLLNVDSVKIMTILYYNLNSNAQNLNEKTVCEWDLGYIIWMMLFSIDFLLCPCQSLVLGRSFLFNSKCLTLVQKINNNDPLFPH